MLGIHEDLDGAIINNKEEYGSWSTSSSNHSTKDIADFDGCQNPWMSFSNFMF